MMQSLAQRQVGKRAVAADADFSTLELRRRFDIRSRHDGFQELVHAAGD